MKKLHWYTGIIGVILIVFSCAAQASTKDEVLKRGHLRCGVSTGLPGFSNPDEKGNWTGLDVDMCKAVAAAVLGDASKIVFVSLMAKERVTSLIAGDIDILSRNTAWTLPRDSAFGLHFAGISYHDQQGLLLRKKRVAKESKELDGMTVCLLSGTSHGDNLARWFTRQDIEFSSLVLDTPDQIVKAFEGDRCDAITGGVAQLSGLQLKFSHPAESLILPETFAKQPLGPAVRVGDDAWFNIVKWTLFALINAEELHISSANVETMKINPDPEIRSFLGIEGQVGKGLGLANNWAYNIVHQVGNYGESFEKNLGSGSSLKLSRGINQLWTRGGILYAPPLQ